MTHRTVHDHVRDWAARLPNATAVVGPGETLSYSELDHRAGLAAEALSRESVGPGSLVVVVLPTDVPFVVCLLAVLKAGAAYVALDPHWPDARIDEVIAAVRPAVVVDADTVVALTGTEGDAGTNGNGLHVPVDVNAAGCAVFTSGTTGVPKVSLTPHRALTRLFDDEEILAQGAVVPQFGSPSWDVLVLEVWGPLVSGGTSVLFSGRHPTPLRLRELIVNHGADHVWLTSSLFNLFVDEDVDSFIGLRRVLTGGERLSPSHVERFLETHPSIELVNGYGPVEACLFATTRRVRPEDTRQPGGIPIGAPVRGSALRVVDDEGVEVSTGDVGELVVAGSGVGLGYLHDSQATASAFVRSPTGAMAYRTGDQVWVDEEGVFHFVGRTDRQVKIRGVRLDLGEVENSALCHEQVLRAHAVGIPDSIGQTTQLGLIVRLADGGPRVTGRDLRAYLATRLPPHLVPDRVSIVGEVPVTSTGKLDSSAVLRRLLSDRHE